MLITTVEIHATEKGKPMLVYHGHVSSIAAALRVVDRNAPAPVCPPVRQRVLAERDGCFRIGSTRAEIGVYA